MKLIFDLPRDHKKIAWLKSRIMLESRYLFGQNSKKSLVNPGIGGFVKLHNYSLFNWCTVFHKKNTTFPITPVQCGFHAGGVIRPYFFVGYDDWHVTVNGVRYRHMLEEFFFFFFWPGGCPQRCYHCHRPHRQRPKQSSCWRQCLVTKLSREMVPSTSPPRSCYFTSPYFFSVGLPQVIGVRKHASDIGRAKNQHKQHWMRNSWNIRWLVWKNGGKLGSRKSHKRVFGGHIICLILNFIWQSVYFQ